MNMILPYSPIHTIEWLEDYFSKNYYKKPYDRFMWWRSYTSKTKPLPKQAPLKDKILNGDFDLGSFTYEVEVVEHRLNKRYTELINDPGRYVEESAVDKARRKRLKEDFEKDENKKLDDLAREFSYLLGITKNQVFDELIEFNGTLIEFYKFITKKYPRTNGIPYL